MVPGTVVRPWTRWQNWGSLIAGLWLFFAPWIFHYTAEAAAYGASGGASPTLDPWNAWIIGGIIVVASILALGLPANALVDLALLVAAVWLFISPWALGFAKVPRVSWDDWIVAVVVFALAGWAWSLARRTSVAAVRRGRAEGNDPAAPGYAPGERHPVNP